VRTAALLAALGTLVACGPDKFAIDLAATKQTWEGAGASLPAWDGNMRELVRSDPWQQLYIADMGMTALRIDLMPTPLDPRGRHSDLLVHFGEDLEANVAMFDYRRSPRAAIYGELAADLEHDLAANTPDSLRVLASIWSPPHWLKDGATLPNGGADSAGGKLRMDPGNLQQYARYVAAAVVAWERRFGVEIDALSIQNEPRFAQQYSSMVFTPDEYATALAAVAVELDRLGLKTKLFGPEDVGYGKEGDRWMIDQQLSYVKAVMAHPVAGPALDAIGVHGYGGDGIDSEGHAAPENWAYYWSQIEGYGLPSWQTETGGGSPQWDGRGTFSEDSKGGPLMLANVLFEAMTFGNVSLWCNWFFTNLQLDPHSLLGADLDTDNPKYAVAKHFFRYIRPGAVRVAVTPADHDGTRVVAWHHAAADQLTIVLLNLRSRAAKVEIDVAGGAGDRVLQRYETTREQNFVQRDATSSAGGHLAIELPPASITTLSEIP
jgi:glucuronoarabinoxylan endo-1,4-beta-xylanase